MDKNKPSKDERGNVRYLWVLVGAYLLYLAWQQLQLLLRGEAVKTGDVILCVVSGVVFAAVGVWVILREWRTWQYAQTRKDDPETGDASEEGKTSADALKSLIAGLTVGSAEDSDAPEVPKLRINADSAKESDEDDEESEDDAPDEDDDDDEGYDDESGEDDDDPGEDDDDPDEDDDDPDEDDDESDEDDDEES